MRPREPFGAATSLGGERSHYELAADVAAFALAVGRAASANGYARVTGRLNVPAAASLAASASA